MNKERKQPTTLFAVVSFFGYYCRIDHYDQLRMQYNTIGICGCDRCGYYHKIFKYSME